VSSSRGDSVETLQSLRSPQDIIVFMVGGATYAEARTVAMMNQEFSSAASNGSAPTSGVKILLGGTCIHNSSSFVDMISAAVPNFGSAVTDPPPEGALSSGPGINLNLGNLSVSVGGAGGTGVYRSSGDGPSLQTEGIRDGVRSLIGKVKLPGV